MKKTKNIKKKSNINYLKVNWKTISLFFQVVKPNYLIKQYILFKVIRKLKKGKLSNDSSNCLKSIIVKNQKENWSLSPYTSHYHNVYQRTLSLYCIPIAMWKQIEILQFFSIVGRCFLLLNKNFLLEASD